MPLQAAAEGVRVVIETCVSCLNRSSSARIRLMYQQRFFQEHVPAIVEGYKAAGAEGKAVYLVALSHLLRSVPKQVLLSELPSLLPLLFESLESTERKLKLSTLNTLYSLTFDAPDL